MVDKDSIKNRLQDILIYYGARPPKGHNKNWSCLPSRHKDPINDLSVKNNICCCHCGLKGDSFAVIAEMEGLDYKNDFLLIANKAADILRLDNACNCPASNLKEDNAKTKNNQEKQKDSDKIFNELTSIITNKFRDSKKIDYKYFYNRGITRPGIYGRHKILVCDPTKIFPSELLPGLRNIWAYQFIIPVWRHGKVVNCILRRDDIKSKENNKTMNLKGLKVELLNCDFLESDKIKYLFICEGWSDALSIENEKRYAIAINSITMINYLVRRLDENREKLKDTIFYIIFDQDENGWGQKASKDLFKKIKELKLAVANLGIKKPFKDINDFYVKEKDKFRDMIKTLTE